MLAEVASTLQQVAEPKPADEAPPVQPSKSDNELVLELKKVEQA